VVQVAGDGFGRGGVGREVERDCSTTGDALEVAGCVVDPPAAVLVAQTRGVEFVRDGDRSGADARFAGQSLGDVIVGKGVDEGSAGAAQYVRAGGDLEGPAGRGRR
jgi:hypothetical protein